MKGYVIIAKEYHNCNLHHQVCSRGRRSPHSYSSSSSCKSVPRKTCTNKPVRKPVQSCQSVPKKKCHQVAEENHVQKCATVPVRTPKQVAYWVCSDNDHFNDHNDAFSAIDLRTNQ